ncbi:MAG: caspase family protein [Pseudomonas sp.]
MSVNHSSRMPRPDPVPCPARRTGVGAAAQPARGASWARLLSAGLLVLAVSVGGLARAQAPAQPRPPEKRIALVVGNARYPAIPLSNPENDARLIADNLRKLGFEVNEQLNLGVIAFRRALRDFARRVQEDDAVAVLYYAGHGVQIDGRNYLLPVDLNLRDQEEVKDESVDIEDLFLARIEKARSHARIVILDACRDNPFAGKTRNIRSVGGLAEMGARGTLIAYASAPGMPAEDGPSGRNSVYTRNLAEEMMVPGLEVEQMFKNVRVKVLRDTRERQVPWVNTSLTSNFSFNPLQGPSPEELAREGEVNRLKAELAQTRRALEEARAAERATAARPAPAAPDASAPAAATAAARPAEPAAPVRPSAPASVAAAPVRPPVSASASVASVPAPASAPTPAVAAAPVAAPEPTAAPAKTGAPAATTQAEAVRVNEQSASRLEAQLERARIALDEARARSRERPVAAAEPVAAVQGDATAPRGSAADRTRSCRDLLARASIGDGLTASEATFLKQECK